MSGLQKMKILAVVVLLLVMVIGVAAGWHWLHTPFAIPADRQQIEVLPGDSLARVTYRLQTDIGLRHPRVLVLYARMKATTNIKRGEYELPAKITPVQLLQRLVEGKVRQRTLTLVEGITFAQAVQLIAQNPYVKAGLDADDIAGIAARLGITQPNPEGWLFPDTYVFTKHTPDWDLLQQSYRRMVQVLNEEWEGRAEGLPYETPYDALIMASIVEKETGAPHERAQIAGVFVRRLQLGMRLQTDPTVIYGMGSAYAGKIRGADLREKTPYNTYTMTGLPPTPIALPGREAIHAALHPAAGDSLYFVARGDGTHQFSATLEEHNAAVKKYQLQRSSNYRSTLQ